MHNKKIVQQSDLATAFYERHKKRIYQIARYLSSNEDECNELMQETLCSLLDRLELLDQLQVEQVEAYIVRTMRNIKINKYVKAKKVPFISLEEINAQALPDDSDAQMEKVLTHIEVIRLMEKLSPEDRLLLHGKYIEGESAQVLAEKLGCKPDSIRMKMLRAKKRAFQILQER